ncbi:Xylose isormerase domain-containing protein, TIM barrel [Desulfonema limicola]|uniref:Xylose isormerase domain-containing protein, TIM barrel n=1 Tax=Desulfonema limicola TaxID=45656 RepID=A0A975B726_9BACT|nr:sugar phosphate isomerase/epimerase family protein [Desulfonema limicola]QTA80031.1 Xylose isormerase domain-containing protein, TIM barrel [Desulfonema limicola]
MKYGAMNNPLNSIISEIEIISSMGFDYLELTMDAPKAHYSIIKQDQKEIRKTLEKHNMELVCHLPTFVYTADLTESIRRVSLEETLLSVETAKETGARKTVLHPSLISGMGMFAIDTAKKYAFESLEIIVNKADKLGLKLCLENMTPQCRAFFKPDEFEEIFQGFPSLFMTFDTGHANINSKEEKRGVDFINKFKHRLAHVHISDNNGKKDEHLPPGKGTINFQEIISALIKTGYNDTATLEIFTENRRQDLLKTRETIDSIIAGLI